jgi:hypothetical protein
MNKILRALAIAVLAASQAGAQKGDFQKIAVERQATPTVSVRLSGALGNVRIIGWERDSISLTGAIGVGSRMDGGPITGTGPVSGMKFYVDAPDEASSRVNKLELRVPRTARVWIKSGSADIDASSVTGGLDLNIIGGSIKVNAKPRELIIESMDGSVQFSGFADYARIKTATGDINLQATGDDFSVNTISGAITVNQVVGGAFQRARFESVTGGITFASDVARGGDVRFDTHSGAIEMRMPGQASVEYDVATITGAIENSITSRRPIVGREGRGMELATSSGMGGARVQVRSFKGNVKLITR